jgi:hypothetical protein
LGFKLERGIDILVVHLGAMAVFASRNGRPAATYIDVRPASYLHPSGLAGIGIK